MKRGFDRTVEASVFDSLRDPMNTGCVRERGARGNLDAKVNVFGTGRSGKGEAGQR